MHLKPKVEPPFYNTTLARFLRDRIDAVAATKNQREIANEVGYDKANIVSMYKRGDAKVPLHTIPAFAKALDADVGHMFRMALEQYWPDLEKQVIDIFGNTVSNNEMEFVKRIRELTAHRDQKMTPDISEKMATVFARSAPPS